MVRPMKIPNDPNVVLQDLNSVGSRVLLAKKYGCTISGLENYFIRKKKRLRRRHEWYYEDVKGE